MGGASFLLGEGWSLVGMSRLLIGVAWRLVGVATASNERIALATRPSIKSSGNWEVGAAVIHFMLMRNNESTRIVC